MKKESLKFLCKHLSHRDFILVFLAHKVEFSRCENSKCAINSNELKKYIPNYNSLMVALYRLQEEKVITRKGKNEWQVSD